MARVRAEGGGCFSPGDGEDGAPRPGPTLDAIVRGVLRGDACTAWGRQRRVQRAETRSEHGCGDFLAVLLRVRKAWGRPPANAGPQSAWVRPGPLAGGLQSWNRKCPRGRGRSSSLM